MDLNVGKNCFQRVIWVDYLEAIYQIISGSLSSHVSFSVLYSDISNKQTSSASEISVGLELGFVIRA